MIIDHSHWFTVSRTFFPRRDITGSGVSPLSKIPHCCANAKGPCLSPDVVDRSPKPTTDHQFGKLLPTPTVLNLHPAHLTASFPLFYISLYDISIFVL